jgi:hypothetical protein
MTARTIEIRSETSSLPGHVSLPLSSDKSRKQGNDGQDPFPMIECYYRLELREGAEAIL